MDGIDSGPEVILIGPMGVGKSTVAYYLAHELEIPWRDTDTQVEKLTQRTVQVLFKDYGEAVFRELEHREVVAALESHSGVLSLGGGAVMHPKTKAALKGRPVVFLDVSADAVWARIGSGKDRPLLQGNALERWVEMMDRRRTTYEELSRWHVDTDGKGARRIAGEIAKLIREQNDGQ